MRTAPACDPRLRHLLGFLLAALRRYDDGAGAGLTLDKAFGLTGRGAVQWWRQERLANRDRALRDIHRRFYPELTASAAAAAILSDLALLDRQAEPSAGSVTADLARAARYDRVPRSDRQIENILNDKEN
jgi:hypothetical protein